MVSYKKMKYCDEAIMDQKVLTEFYDHELDQTKMWNVIKYKNCTNNTFFLLISLSSDCDDV